FDWFVVRGSRARRIDRADNCGADYQRRTAHHAQGNLNRLFRFGGLLFIVCAFARVLDRVDMCVGGALWWKHSMGFLYYAFAAVGARSISRPRIRARDGVVDSDEVGLDVRDWMGSGLS